MKSIALLLLAFCLVLSGCGAQGQGAAPEAEESGQEVLEQSEKEEQDDVVKEKLDVAAEVRGQLETIREALEGIEPGEPEEMLGNASGAIADLGYPLRVYGEAMPNYESVVSFMNGTDGNMASLFRVDSWAPASVSALTFVREDGYRCFYSYLSQDEAGEWELDVNAYGDFLDSLELTEQGNLLWLSEGSAEYNGMRVVPLSGEQYRLYDEYVQLVDSQSDGVVNTLWSAEEGFAYLPWDLVFDHIWTVETAERLDWGSENPYYREEQKGEYNEYYFAFPAEIVEETLQRYFDVPVETLRGMESELIQSGTLYDPAENIYRIYGFRGGGYKPAVEVWDSRENPDGSLELDLAWVSLDFGNEGYIYSTLTVMPGKNGGHTYLSNLYSEETVRSEVSHSLQLAESLELVQQGEFKTQGESVEIGGQVFTPVDTQDLYDKVVLGGLFSTESIAGWYTTVFAPETAKNYLDKVLAIPLYADGEPDEDGMETLLVNVTHSGAPISTGRWDLDTLKVREIHSEQITVEMDYITGEGSNSRALTLVRGGASRWLLTDSYEGARE